MIKRINYVLKSILIFAMIPIMTINIQAIDMQEKVPAHQGKGNPYIQVVFANPGEKTTVYSDTGAFPILGTLKYVEPGQTYEVRVYLQGLNQGFKIPKNGFFGGIRIPFKFSPNVLFDYISDSKGTMVSEVTTFNQSLAHINQYMIDGPQSEVTSINKDGKMIVDYHILKDVNVINTSSIDDNLLCKFTIKIRDTATANTVLNIKENKGDQLFLNDFRKANVHWADINNHFNYIDFDVNNPIVYAPVINYKIKVTQEGYGGVSTPAAATITKGKAMTVRAFPTMGSHFVRWEVISGGVTLSSYEDTTSTFVMPSNDVELKAIFAEDTFNVNTIIEGLGTVNVSPSISNIPWEVVTLEAIPEEGFHFVGWEVVDLDYIAIDTPTSDTAKFEMPAEDVTIKAVFEKNKYTVTTTAEGFGGVLTSPKVQNEAGDLITLTAYADEENHFIRWEVVNGNVKLNTPNKETMDFIMPEGDVTIKAIFGSNKYDIDVIIEGAGGVSTSPSTLKNEIGQNVKLTARPDIGYHFVKWEIINGAVTLDDDTSPKITFAMPNKNVEVKAIFAKNVYEAIVQKEGKGTATASKEKDIVRGETITLSAKADEGYHFVKWDIVNGAVTLDNDTNPSTTFTMPNENVEVKAIFALNQVVPEKTYHITISKQENGTVTASKEKDIVSGETITLSAKAEEGYHFEKWEIISGTITLSDDNNPSATFAMPNENVEVKAIFALNQVVPEKTYHITISKQENGTVTASKEKDIASGETITISAKADQGYHFEKWRVVSGAITLSDDKNPTTTFTMSHENVEVQAIFAVNQYEIMFDSNGGSLIPTQIIKHNQPIVFPTHPMKKGYEFNSWHLKDGTKWDSDKRVTSGITLYANWTEIKKPVLPYTGDIYTTNHSIFDKVLAVFLVIGLLISGIFKIKIKKMMDS